MELNRDSKIKKSSDLSFISKMMLLVTMIIIIGEYDGSAVYIVSFASLLISFIYFKKWMNLNYYSTIHNPRYKIYKVLEILQILGSVFLILYYIFGDTSYYTEGIGRWIMFVMNTALLLSLDSIDVFHFAKEKNLKNYK